MIQHDDELQRLPLERARALATRFYTDPAVLELDRCRVEFDYYYSADCAARSERDQSFSDDIQREDIAICEAVQRGLVSESYVGGRLCPRREAGVWHFQNLLRDAYRRG